MTKANSQSDNADFLKVDLSILEKKNVSSEDGTTQEVEEVVEQRSLGFPLGISDEELQAELQKFLSTYHSDKQLAIDNAELEKQHASADKLIENFSGRHFTLELNERVHVQENVGQ